MHIIKIYRIKCMRYFFNFVPFQKVTNFLKGGCGNKMYV